jgi:5-methylcytosine-specific restriction endonuclease McrA
VRISEWDAKALLAFVRRFNRSSEYRSAHAAADKLDAALQPKIARPAKVNHKPRKPTRTAKNAETARIYAEVEKRAAGRCENPECRKAFGISLQDKPEMDHFWGHGKGRLPQKTSNCWMLCGSCHLDKTRNRPSRAQWLKRYRQHANENVYVLEYGDATRALEVAEMKEEQTNNLSNRKPKVSHG